MSLFNKEKLAKLGIYNIQMPKKDSTLYLVSLTPYPDSITGIQTSNDLMRLTNHTVKALSQSTGDTIVGLGAHPGIRNKQYVLCEGIQKWRNIPTQRTLQDTPNPEHYTAGSWMLLQPEKNQHLPPSLNFNKSAATTTTSPNTLHANSRTGCPSTKTTPIAVSCNPNMWKSFKNSQTDDVSKEEEYKIHQALHEVASLRWKNNSYMMERQEASCPLNTWNNLTRLATYHGGVGQSARKSLIQRGNLEIGDQKARWILAEKLAEGYTQGVGLAHGTNCSESYATLLRKAVNSIIKVNKD